MSKDLATMEKLQHNQAQRGVDMCPCGWNCKPVKMLHMLWPKHCVLGPTTAKSVIVHLMRLDQIRLILYTNNLLDKRQIYYIIQFVFCPTNYLKYTTEINHLKCRLSVLTQEVSQKCLFIFIIAIFSYTAPRFQWLKGNWTIE